MRLSVRTNLRAALVTAIVVGACADETTNAPSVAGPDLLLASLPSTLFQTNFTTDAAGFTYADDAFRGTAQPLYASGAYLASGAFSGGGLRVTVGGVNNNTINGMSGGWRRDVTLESRSSLSLTFRYNLNQGANYESDERSEVLVSVNGALRGTGANDYVARVVGNGNGGSNVTTGWVLVTLELGVLDSGTHVLGLGGYNSKKNASNESTTITLDDVSIAATPIIPDAFAYVDDAFRGTNAASYAAGDQLADGSLRVTLGGINATTINGMSGGWRRTITVTNAGPAVLTLRYALTQSAEYESDERSEVVVTVDGGLRGVRAGDYVARLVGDGNGGTEISTGSVTIEVDLGWLAAGEHVLTLGGYNSKKTLADEITQVVIEDMSIEEAGPHTASALVEQLDFDRFRANVETLAAFGDRTQGAASNVAAGNWIAQQLESYGYTVERPAYTYGGAARTNFMATRVGSRFPDRMYIISGHMDGRGGGGGADDDASGTSLVLEAARAFAAAETHYSVRFILWNNEETGLNGSAAYVSQRAALRGAENPVGSGLFPEPKWLGIVQHDMIMFDHGLPPGPDQIAAADVDVEYQSASSFAGPALFLAQRLSGGNASYSTDYPAQVGSNMRNTDSYSFISHTAAVSVRENQRIAEIGNGSNPHWHQPTDLVSTYSLADFRLGFNAVQMTVGTIAELVLARMQ